METLIEVVLIAVIVVGLLLSGYYTRRNLNSYREMSRMAEDQWRQERRGR